MSSFKLFDDEIVKIFDKEANLLKKFCEQTTDESLALEEIKSKYPEHRYALIDFKNPLGIWLCKDISCLDKLLKIFQRFGALVGCMDLKDDKVFESCKCIIKGFDDEY